MTKQTLTLQSQLDKNVKKANQKIYLLRKIRNNLDNDSTLKMFKTMVLPYIEFASVLFSGCTEKDEIRLQRVQNKGLKLSLNKNWYYDTKLLHKEANLANWETRTHIVLNRLMFKYKYNENFVDDRRLHTGSHGGTLFKLERPNSTHFIRSLSYSIRQSWNY